MSTYANSEKTVNQLPEVVANHARRTAGEAARVLDDDTTRALNPTADTSTALDHALAPGTVNGFATLKARACRSRLPVVVGVIVLGAAVGSMLMRTRRKPTFRERFADEPSAAMRGAILGALAPAAQRLHEGYDTARDRAGKTLNRVHAFGPARVGRSFPSRFGRLRNHLKFW